MKKIRDIEGDEKSIQNNGCGDSPKSITTPLKDQRKRSVNSPKTPKTPKTPKLPLSPKSPKSPKSKATNVLSLPISNFGFNNQRRSTNKSIFSKNIQMRDSFGYGENESANLSDENSTYMHKQEANFALEMKENQNLNYDTLKKQPVLLILS